MDQGVYSVGEGGQSRRSRFECAAPLMARVQPPEGPPTAVSFAREIAFLTRPKAARATLRQWRDMPARLQSWSFPRPS